MYSPSDNDRFRDFTTDSWNDSYDFLNTDTFTLDVPVENEYSSTISQPKDDYHHHLRRENFPIPQPRDKPSLSDDLHHHNQPFIEKDNSIKKTNYNHSKMNAFEQENVSNTMLNEKNVIDGRDKQHVYNHFLAEKKTLTEILRGIEMTIQSQKSLGIEYLPDSLKKTLHNLPSIAYSCVGLCGFKVKKRIYGRETEECDTETTITGKRNRNTNENEKKDYSFVGEKKRKKKKIFVVSEYDNPMIDSLNHIHTKLSSIVDNDWLKTSGIEKKFYLIIDPSGNQRKYISWNHLFFFSQTCIREEKLPKTLLFYETPKGDKYFFHTKTYSEEEIISRGIVSTCDSLNRFSLFFGSLISGFCFNDVEITTINDLCKLQLPRGDLVIDRVRNQGKSESNNTFHLMKVALSKSSTFTQIDRHTGNSNICHILKKIFSEQIYKQAQYVLQRLIVIIVHFDQTTEEREFNRKNLQRNDFIMAYLLILSLVLKPIIKKANESNHIPDNCGNSFELPSYEEWCDCEHFQKVDDDNNKDNCSENIVYYS